MSGTCSWCGSRNDTRSQCDEDPLPLIGETPVDDSERDDDDTDGADE